MKLEDLRPSFTVYLISSKSEALKAPGEVVGEAGYLCLQFEDLTSAFSEVFQNPPHFVIMDMNEDKFDIKKAFKEVKTQLPESHLYLLAPMEARERVAEFFQLGLYDVLWTPPTTSKEWIKALDRAAERDYFMYMNEQLQKGAAPNLDLAQLVDLHKELTTRQAVAECLQDFLAFGSKLLGDCGALYLRFLPLRKILTAAQAHNVLAHQWKGIGIDLSEDPEFRWPMLREPQSISAIREMISEVFQRHDFQALTLEIAKEIAGVAVFFGGKPTPESLEILGLGREMLQTSAGFLELEKRLHSVSTKDDTTGVFNRAYFNERANAEVTRARRNQHPLSVILMAVDSYDHAVNDGGPEEGHALLRLLSRVLEKHSRVTDVVARSSNDEFAILLPDTDISGATIKAERLRRMISSADFSKVLRSTPQVTISVGVSEYPSVCRDADELFQTADEALTQVRQKTNRVCMAKPAGSFTPDFTVPSKEKPA